MKQIARSIKKIMCNEFLNKILRKVLKFRYISSAIPEKFLVKIPVSGILSFQAVNSKTLYLKTDGNDIVVQDIYWKGLNEFEGLTIPIFIKLLKFTQTFLDIGANTGLYSLIAAIDSSDRKVYAFEPVPSILPYLKTNIELNSLDNIQICPTAVTNYDGEITLYIPSDVIPTSASTMEGFRESEKVISVPALTLDSFSRMNNVSNIDLIKIDTETTEYLVLEGAKYVWREMSQSSFVRF